jgi:hypothetical protein
MQVHQFPQILGDNPACSAGAPLTLDWEPVAQTTMHIDYYEFTRDPRRNRRGLTEGKEDRHNYLLSIGVGTDQIEQVLADIESAKKDRAASLKKQTWGGFFKVVQSAASKKAPSFGRSAPATAKPATTRNRGARSA